MQIPFAPIAYPKTLYYQLDSDRHTKSKVLNAEVKGMCNLLVNCDLGLAVDDLNMKPHIYNIQEGTNIKYDTIHEADLALINEDI